MRGGAVATGAWVAALALLGAFTLYAAVHFDYARSSIDLYHPWGIPEAHDALGRATNPYADAARYGAHIYARAGAIADPKLRWARAFWRSRSAAGIEPTGTPFFYAVLAAAPRDFGSLRLLHSLLEHAAIVAAVLLLARTRGLPWLASLCAAALVAGTYLPFLDSVRVANVGAMQLAVLAGMIAAAQARWFDRHALVDRGYLAVLALFVLFKPNTLLIAAGLAAHYGVVCGARRFRMGAAIAAAAALVAAAFSAAYFGSASVWLDWLRYVLGINGGTLEYTAAQGNLALAMLLFDRTDQFAPQTWAMMLAASFALIVLAYATGQGREPHRIAPVARAWLADPWMAAGVTTLATFVATPLLWPHYLVFALIPIAWLAAGPRDWTARCAIASFLGMSLIVTMPLVAAGLDDAIDVSTAFAWTLMLPAALARLSRAARAVPT